MANVKIIAPTAQKPQTLRVAAYCRVSSDSADQLHSYAAQIRAYTDLIRQHDGWELVDIYADEGLTGTRMDKREEFGRLMADCRKGKIDKVLVKSISRFARNTKDCLASLRELKSLGVSVQFEQENINTETLTTELMVSVSGSLAQQESVSISENMRMSYQRRMQRGEFITCKAPFGYRLVDGKRLEIIPEEAEVVRWMFDAYLSGRSLAWIAERMNERKIPTTDGANVWRDRSVNGLLKNEKYIGDSLCQKTFTSGFPFIKQRNHGQRQQYYSVCTHPAIVSKEVFDRVQELRRKKLPDGAVIRIQYPLSGKIICAECGRTFIRRYTKHWVSWVCHTHDTGAAGCSVGRIEENEIFTAFIRMQRKLKQFSHVILKPALTQMERVKDTLHRSDPAMLEINLELAQAAEQSHKIAQLQAAGVLDQDACAAKLTAINGKLNHLRAERQRMHRNQDIDTQIQMLQNTMDRIKDAEGDQTEFDEILFADLVEKIVAVSQEEIRFCLYGGIELTEHIQGARR